jgi:hypothetical protein
VGPCANRVPRADLGAPFFGPCHAARFLQPALAMLRCAVPAGLILCLSVACSQAPSVDGSAAGAGGVPVAVVAGAAGTPPSAAAGAAGAPPMVAACTPGDYFGCTVPGFEYSGRACQPDGTCLCDADAQIDPETGRCRPPPACDEVSSPFCGGPMVGECWDGQCVCFEGYEVDPETHLCRDVVPCRSAMDPTQCDGDAYFGYGSPLKGTCQADGSCACYEPYGNEPMSGTCTMALGCVNAGPPVVGACDDTATALPGSPLNGTCRSDATCRCNDGYQLNPQTGRCAPVPRPCESVSSASACNDDPAVSAIQGTCQVDGTCLCAAPYVFNATTGRCAISGPCDPNQVESCTEGVIRGVEDYTGWCLAPGDCECLPGYQISAATGRCVPAPQP